MIKLELITVYNYAELIEIWIFGIEAPYYAYSISCGYKLIVAYYMDCIRGSVST